MRLKKLEEQDHHQQGGLEITSKAVDRGHVQHQHAEGGEQHQHAGNQMEGDQDQVTPQEENQNP